MIGSLFADQSNLNAFLFSNITFNHTFDISSSTLKHLSFKGVKFKSSARFQHLELKESPKFVDCEFSHNTSFHGARFNDVNSDASEGNYRRLKGYMRGIDNDADEALFSSYELQSRHKNLFKVSKVDYIVSLIYWLVNSYGRNVYQPFIAGFSVWLIFFFIIFQFDAVRIQTSATTGRQRPEFEIQTLNRPLEELNWIEKSALDSRAYQAAKFSAINMLGPLRLVSSFDSFKPTSFVFVVVTWLQSIFATILWYLIIVGIKRKFRTG